MFEGLRKPKEFVVIVVTLLAYGCPIQAIVHAYGDHVADLHLIHRYNDTVNEQFYSLPFLLASRLC